MFLPNRLIQLMWNRIIIIVSALLHSWILHIIILISIIHKTRAASDVKRVRNTFCYYRFVTNSISYTILSQFVSRPMSFRRGRTFRVVIRPKGHSSRSRTYEKNVFLSCTSNSLSDTATPPPLRDALSRNLSWHVYRIVLCFNCQGVWSQ